MTYTNNYIITLYGNITFVPCTSIDTAIILK